MKQIYGQDPCPKTLTKEEWEVQKLGSVWNVAADLKEGSWDLLQMAPDFLRMAGHFANMMPKVAQAALGYEAMIMVSLNIMKERNEYAKRGVVLEKQLKKACKVIGELVTDFELYQVLSKRSESYLTIMAEAKMIQEAGCDFVVDTQEAETEKIPEAGLHMNSQITDSLLLTQYDGKKKGDALVIKDTTSCELGPRDVAVDEDVRQAQLKKEEKGKGLLELGSDTELEDNGKGIVDWTIEPQAPKKEMDVRTLSLEKAKRTLNVEEDSSYSVAEVQVRSLIAEKIKLEKELEEVKKSKEEIRSELESLRTSLRSADYTPSEEKTLPWLAWVNRLQDREAMVSKAQHELKKLSATSNVVSEHVHDSLERFNKYVGSQGHGRTEVTVWGDVEEMMERTNFNRKGKAKDIDWRLEIEEGWVSYNTLSSDFLEDDRKIISTCDPPPPVLKEKCIVCQHHFGPEGAYTLGQCGHNFHVTCISKCALTKSACPVCRSPISTRFYEVMGIRDLMPPGHEFNRWNLPLDQLPNKFHNYIQWGKPLEWNSSTSSHNLIAQPDVDKDPLYWMTRDYEVEIRARDIDNSEQREVFCRNFGGHWSIDHKRFFRFPPKRVEKREDGSYHEITDDIELHESYKKYDHTLIGRALVLAKLEEAAKLRISMKDESFEEADINFWDALQIYVKHIDDAISHWRTSLENPTPELLMSITAEESFVNDVVAQIESAMDVFRSKKVDPGKKRKRGDGNESDDSWRSGHNREIAAVDREYEEGGRIAHASQRPRTRSTAQVIGLGEPSVAME